MLKILGSVAIILSATILGIKKYNTFFERKKTLTEIFDGAGRIESKLSSVCMPLCESFRDCGPFFERASELILSGMLPEEAVKESALRNHSLNDEDIRIINRFATGLCAEDCSGQLSNISVFIKNIEQQLAEATNQLSTKGVLYIKGSILTASAIVLLLV